MKFKSLALYFLLFTFMSATSAKAQNQIRSIEIKDENGFLELEIPLHSIKMIGDNSFEIRGEGQLENSLQTIRLQVKPNLLPQREGITHTDKSCTISFEEKLFRTLARRLLVTLPKTSIRLNSHTFDAQAVEGTFENVGKKPLKLLLIDLVSDDLYSEWYLEIDVQKKSILLSEKNNEYREPFLNTFIK